MDAVMVRLYEREKKLLCELELIGPRASLTPEQRRGRAKIAARLHAVRTAMFLKTQMQLEFK